MPSVPGALLGAMLSCTVFGDNLARGNDLPETLCSPRGFATLLYTSEGNRDLMDSNGFHALEFVNTGDDSTYVKFHWENPHSESQVSRCEWHSSPSSKTSVGFRFSVRVPSFLSDTPSQALVASSGSNSHEFSCSG